MTSSRRSLRTTLRGQSNAAAVVLLSSLCWMLLASSPWTSLVAEAGLISGGGYDRSSGSGGTRGGGGGGGGKNLLPPTWGAPSMCERIHPEDLPEECTCSEKEPYGLVVACAKTFNSSSFNDTIGMKIDIDPCNKDGSSVSVDVTEAEHGIDFPIAAVRAGEEKNVPIPGLSVIVPGIGHVGIDAAILVTGNPDSLTLKVGLNACAKLAHKEICAGAIPGLSDVLPWYVLSGTYTFGDICSGNSSNSRTAALLEEGPVAAVA